MASEIQVYKAAATAVGSSSQITSPTDDRPVARAIRNVWDINRRAALRDAAWNFAMARAELPALAQAPVFGFDSAFQLPADSVRLIEVFGEARAEYQVEGRKVLADVSGPLRIRYIRDVTEPSEWDDEFAMAFGLRIGWMIGEKIAGSSFNQDRAWRNYREALVQAKTSDGSENPPIGQEESDWIRARWAGSREDAMHLWHDGGI